MGKRRRRRSKAEGPPRRQERPPAAPRPTTPPTQPEPARDAFLVPHPRGGAPIALPRPDPQTSWLSRLMMALLRGYKWYLSPLLGAHCRFTPSCSVYAMEAFKKYGFLRGAARSMGRLARCNPLCEGGYDPP